MGARFVNEKLLRRRESRGLRRVVERAGAVDDQAVRPAPLFRVRPPEPMATVSHCGLAAFPAEAFRVTPTAIL
jgi:hypothetical protein